MRRVLLSLVCVVPLLTGLAGAASAAKRVALVVGNDDYAHVAKLHKAVNDARALGGVLETVGFTVLRAENVARRDLNRRLLEFTSRLEVGDTALFFFAGHGVEIEGRNYLLPTDIPVAGPGQESFVKAEAIPVDQVLDELRRRGARISILVLDACRDNPFKRVGTRSLGSTRGLARMAAPEGTFIMYSAGVGQTALDRLSDADADPNSVFTRSLIPLLTEPGLSLTQTARTVRRRVQALAAGISHQQRPAYYDEVTGDFFFARRAIPGADRASPAAGPAPGPGAAEEIEVAAQRPDRLPAGKAAPPPPRLPETSSQQEALPPADRLPDAFTRIAVLSPAELELADVPEAPGSDAAQAPAAACSALARDPRDAGPGERGADLEEIPTRDALQACKAAVVKSPGDGQAKHQLARALQSAGDVKKAGLWYRKAAAAGSVSAMMTLAHYENYGAIDQARVQHWLARAAATADPYAMQAFALHLDRLDDPESRGWFDKAMTEIRARAEAGDTRAMRALASARRQGLGGPPDRVEARKWLAKAAAAGDADAMSALAYLMSEIDPGEAVAWYQKAAAAGNRRAEEKLAEIYYFGPHGEQGMKIGRSWHERSLARLRRAAAKGNAAAMSALARAAAGSSGIGRIDLAEALRWREMAAATGAPQYLFELGDHYRYTLYEQKLGEKAAPWYRKAAEAGHVQSLERLGDMYLHGYTVAKDTEEGHRWYRKAKEIYEARANRGDIGALKRIAEMHLWGWLGTPDAHSEAPSPAVPLFERVAAAGKGEDSSWAFKLLAYYYARSITIRGRYGPRDVERAKEWAAKSIAYDAARQERRLGGGSASYHYYELGRTYLTGNLAGYWAKDTVEPDPDRGARYLWLAAVAGNSSAVERLAALYQQTTVLSVDGKGLDRWQGEWTRQKAAKAVLGDYSAATALMKAYETGDVVPKDASRAARWRQAYREIITKKAALGHAWATDRLKSLDQARN